MNTCPRCERRTIAALVPVEGVRVRMNQHEPMSTFEVCTTCARQLRAASIGLTTTLAPVEGPAELEPIEIAETEPDRAPAAEHEELRPRSDPGGPVSRWHELDGRAVYGGDELELRFPDGTWVLGSYHWSAFRCDTGQRPTFRGPDGLELELAQGARLRWPAQAREAS